MKIFIFYFLLAIKTAGSVQKLRVGQISGNTAIVCLRLILKMCCFMLKIACVFSYK